MLPFARYAIGIQKDSDYLNYIYQDNDHLNILNTVLITVIVSRDIPRGLFIWNFCNSS